MNIFGSRISDHDLLLAALAVAGPVVIVVMCAFVMGREKEMFAILFLVVIALCFAGAR